MHVPVIQLSNTSKTPTVKVLPAVKVVLLRPGLSYASTAPLAVTATWTNVVGDALMVASRSGFHVPHTAGSKKWYATWAS